MSLDRYLRQMRFPPLGEEGQRRLLQGRALVCGCGALGSAAANTLVRAGVGTVRIVDRDVVELSNLQRQVLFDEEDARRGSAQGDCRGGETAGRQRGGRRRADRRRRRSRQRRAVLQRRRRDRRRDGQLRDPFSA